MTLRLTHAIAATMLVSGPAFAQEVMVTTAAPLTGFGLIDAFSAREGAYSKVLDQLSRINTNVEIGTRPGGVLARLAAAAGPDGWPPRSPDQRLGAIIEGWNQSITNSKLLVDFMEYQASDLFKPVAPVTDEAGRPTLSFMVDNEAQLPPFSEPLPTVLAAPAFHEVFPFNGFGGGFFGSF